jgi:hypothetical protein
MMNAVQIASCGNMFLHSFKKICTDVQEILGALCNFGITKGRI